MIPENNFGGESDQRPEMSSWPLTSNTSFSYSHLMTFSEDGFHSFEDLEIPLGSHVRVYDAVYEQNAPPHYHSLLTPVDMEKEKWGKEGKKRQGFTELGQERKKQWQVEDKRKKREKLEIKTDLCLRGAGGLGDVQTIMDYACYVSLLLTSLFLSICNKQESDNVNIGRVLVLS
jgi:hypothetical protein